VGVKNIAYPLIAVTTWGLWAFLPKIATRYISPASAMIYEVLAGILMAVIVLRVSKPEISVKQRGSIYAFINGVIGYVGVLFYIYAISGQDAILIAPIAPLSGTFPVVTLVLGAVFLKERFSIPNYVGILLAFGAVYLILS
jgi:transporter family protein